MKGFPIPEDFEAGKAHSMTTGGGTLYDAYYTGKGTPDQIFTFYKQSLLPLGWTEDTTKTLGATSIVAFYKGTTDHSVTITITSKGADDLEIHVAYTLYTHA